MVLWAASGRHTLEELAEKAGRARAKIQLWLGKFKAWNIQQLLHRDTPPGASSPLSARSFADAVTLAKSHGGISCLTIIPGYDDTKIRKPVINAERQDGQTYRVLWEEAIRADPDWVLITSWNEWHEGSEIEPSWESGDTYLKITGAYAPRFKAATPRQTPSASTIS